MEKRLIIFILVFLVTVFGIIMINVSGNLGEEIVEIINKDANIKIISYRDIIITSPVDIKCKWVDPNSDWKECEAIMEIENKGDKHFNLKDKEFKNDFKYGIDNLNTYVSEDYVLYDKSILNKTCYGELTREQKKESDEEKILCYYDYPRRNFNNWEKVTNVNKITNIKKNSVKGMKLVFKSPMKIENGKYLKNQFNFTLFGNDYDVFLDPDISACAELSTSGATYILTADIIDSSTPKCMNFSGGNITLDCQGHTIDGDDSAEWGIWIYRTSDEKTSETIINCTITGWNAAGIRIQNAGNNTIKFSNISFNTKNGIDIWYFDNNMIFNNTISSNGIYGIMLESGDNNNISYNYIYHNTMSGINTIFGSDTNIIYNNFFNNTVNVEFFGIGYGDLWNITKQKGTRVYSNGNQIGGNFYANPTGTGYSETCTDANYDGFCDDAYTLDAGDIDYLPLSTNYISMSPIFYSISDFAKDEDFTQFTIDLSANITDDDPDSDLKIEWSETNTTAVYVDSIDNSTDIITFKSKANQSGSSTINLTVWDTDGNQNSTQFTLTINAVNDAPWVDGLSDITMDEDNGTSLVYLQLELDNNFRDVEGDQSPTSTVVQSQSDTSMVSCSLVSDDLQCVTVANQSGFNDVTIRYTDSGSTTVDEVIRINVNAVNDAPYFDLITNGSLSITEDTASQNAPVNLSIYWRDVESGTWTSITVTDNSSDVTCTDSGEAIQCSPTNNYTGRFIVNIDASDGTTSAFLSYEVDVTNVNDPPLFTDYPIINSTNGQNYTTEDLWCRFTPEDADNSETLTANVSWLKDNVSQFTFTSQSITQDAENSFNLKNDNLTADDLWNCQIEICDDDNSCTDLFNSTQLTILQNISISNENYKPDNIFNNQSATLNATILGSLLDTVWIRANYTGNYVNYTNLTGFTNDGNVWSYFIDDGNFTNQDNISWTFYANDTLGNELAGTFQSFIVENRNATIVSGEVQIAPDPALDTDTLNCTVGDRYDYDGEEINFYYEWYNNSVLFPTNVDSQNITSGNLTSGDKWQCKVIPYDIWENGTKINSQIIEIGSSNVGPSLTSTNATTQGTTTISSSSNPTNNNSAITFYVGFTDSVDALDDGFSAYFCKTDSFTFPDTCNGAGEWVKNQSNTTRNVYSADFTITSSETDSSYNFYSFVTDNNTVSSSLSGNFYVNHPPDLPNITISNETKYTTRDINLTFTTSDSDSDVITSYIYIEQNGTFDLNGTTTNQGFNFTGFPDGINYTWFVESIDEHDFSSGNSSMKSFQTDYTIPNSTVTPTSFTLTSTGQTATIVVSQEDNTALDSCYFRFTAGGSPSTYTKTTCNTNLNLDSTNLTFTPPRTYFLDYLVNDTFGNENLTSIDFTATKSTPSPPSVGGNGGRKRDEVLKLPANITNLTLLNIPLLSPGVYIIDKIPFIPFSFLTEKEVNFTLEVKSNWEIKEAISLSGNFETKVVNNTVLIMLNIKRGDFFIKLEQGSVRITDVFGRNVFIDPLIIRVVNLGWRPIPFIPIPIPVYATVGGILGFIFRKRLSKQFKKVTKFITKFIKNLMIKIRKLFKK